MSSPLFRKLTEKFPMLRVGPLIFIFVHESPALSRVEVNAPLEIAHRLVSVLYSRNVSAKIARRKFHVSVGVGHVYTYVVV